MNCANGGSLTLQGLPSQAFAPWAVVTDATSTGFGTINGSGQLVRYTNTSALVNTAADGADYTTNPATDTGVSQYSGGTLTLQSGAGAIDSLFINAAAPGTLALNGQTLSLAANALGMSGTASYTISGGALGASGSTLTVIQLGSGTLNLNCPISGGAGGLTAAGSGLVVLGALNSYTGPTVVSGGTLQLGSGGSIPNGNPVTTTGMGVLDLNGQSAEFRTGCQRRHDHR